MKSNSRRDLLDALDVARDSIVLQPTPARTVSLKASSCEDMTLPRRLRILSEPQYNNEPPTRRTDHGPRPDNEVFRHPFSPIELIEESVPGYEPAKYIDEAETDAQLPGTAAFYKSRKFQRKVVAGNVLVPGKAPHDSPIGSDDYESCDKKEKPKRLIMIFGRTNVRRATVKNKFNARLQRSNKRM
jgi:hypothetical protein